MISLSITLVRHPLAQPAGFLAHPTQVTTNAAPPGTAVNVFLLACVAGLLASASGRLTSRMPVQGQVYGASSILWELAQHIVQMGAVLSTTIVRTSAENTPILC